MIGYLCFLTSMVVVLGLPGYRDRIPNGHNVPNPCRHNAWQPVGHLVYDIHLANYTNLNDFGKNWQANNHVWTKHLCHLDSDHDGKSNGVELGDPGCTWAIGATPSQSATGHPGINENTFDCSSARG